MAPSKVRLVTGLLLCSFSPLAADWQFTRWSMTETELIVAAPNVFSANDSSLESNLKIGTLGLTARYVFQAVGSTTSLSEVRLTPKRKQDCAEIVQLLRQKYGPSYTTNGISGYTGAMIATWRDQASGNKVELIRTAACEIVYSPLDADPKDGL